MVLRICLYCKFGIPSDSTTEFVVKFIVTVVLINKLRNMRLQKGSM